MYCLNKWKYCNFELHSEEDWYHEQKKKKKKEKKKENSITLQFEEYVIVMWIEKKAVIEIMKGHLLNQSAKCKMVFFLKK